MQYLGKHYLRFYSVNPGPQKTDLDVFIIVWGDSIDSVRTSRQHISYHLNLIHMNYNNTSVFDNPKDSSLCNIFILKKY